MDRLVWAGRHTVRVGDYHLGLRASTPELLERLGQLLGAHLISDAAAPANYSLQVNGAGKFDFLFRSSLVEVRSRSPRRLIDGLLAHLGFYADESADGLLAVDAMALVTEDRAYLVPWELRPSLDRLERRLNRAGYAVADERYALLDLDAGELVTGRTPLVLDTDALGGHDGASERSVRGESVVAPGRHPLAGWLLLGADTDVTPIDAVALTARLTRNAHLLGAQPSLTGLAGLLSRLRLGGLREWHREALLAGLERLAR